MATGVAGVPVREEFRRGCPTCGSGSWARARRACSTRGAGGHRRAGGRAAARARRLRGARPAQRPGPEGLLGRGLPRHLTRDEPFTDGGGRIRPVPTMRLRIPSARVWYVDGVTVVELPCAGEGPPWCGSCSARKGPGPARCCPPPGPSPGRGSGSPPTRPTFSCPASPSVRGPRRTRTWRRSASTWPCAPEPTSPASPAIPSSSTRWCRRRWSRSPRRASRRRPSPRSGWPGARPRPAARQWSGSPSTGLRRRRPRRRRGAAALRGVAAERAVRRGPRGLRGVRRISERRRCQSVGPARSRRTSRTSVYEALRKSTAPATGQRTDAPERWSRTEATSSTTAVRTPRAEIRALMRWVTRTSSSTTPAGRSEADGP